jgi:hypothetical protein
MFIDFWSSLFRRKGVKDVNIFEKKKRLLQIYKLHMLIQIRFSTFRNHIFIYNPMAHYSIVSFIMHQKISINKSMSFEFLKIAINLNKPDKKSLRNTLVVNYQCAKYEITN